MSEMTSSRPWVELQKAKDFDDPTLERAMSDVEKLEKKRVQLQAESDSLALIRTVEAAGSAALKAAKKRDKKKHAVIVKNLEELAKLAERRVKEIDVEDAQREKEAEEAAQVEEGGDASDDDSAAGDLDALRGLMRQLGKQRLPFAFGIVSDKGPRFMLLHKTKKGGALATQLKSEAGCKKFTFGTATGDGPQLNLDVEGGSISGLAAHVKAFLSDSKPTPFSKVNLVQPAADGATGEKQKDEVAEEGRKSGEDVVTGPSGDAENSSLEAVEKAEADAEVANTKMLERRDAAADRLSKLEARAPADEQEQVQDVQPKVRGLYDEASERREAMRGAVASFRRDPTRKNGSAVEFADERFFAATKRADDFAEAAIAAVERKIGGGGPEDGSKPFRIGASVGQGGANAEDDVIAVQTALNRNGASLDVDGKVGGKTIAAIKAFQAKLGFFQPDGLVEPDRNTAIALAGGKPTGPTKGQGGGAKKPAVTDLGEIDEPEPKDLGEIDDDVVADGAGGEPPAERPVFKIGKSIGQGGVNDEDDVRALQVELNARRNLGLAVDGKMGPKTIKAIKDFQKSMGTFQPDGLIEPGRNTARALAGETFDKPTKPKGGGKPVVPKKKVEPTDLGEIDDDGFADAVQNAAQSEIVGTQRRRFEVAKRLEDLGARLARDDRRVVEKAQKKIAALYENVLEVRSNKVTPAADKFRKDPSDDNRQALKDAQAEFNKAVETADDTAVAEEGRLQDRFVGFTVVDEVTESSSSISGARTTTKEGVDEQGDQVIDIIAPGTVSEEQVETEGEDDET